MSLYRVGHGQDSRDFAEERVYSSLTPGHIGPQQNRSQEKVSEHLNLSKSLSMSVFE